MKKFKKYLTVIASLFLVIFALLLHRISVRAEVENDTKSIHSYEEINDVGEIKAEFVEEETNNFSAATTNDETVIITRGNVFSYDGYHTREYWVEKDGRKYLGVCAEPTKFGPDGDALGYSILSKSNYIRYLLWCFQDDEFRKEVFGDYSWEEQFIRLHMTIGYYYSRDVGADDVSDPDYWIAVAEDILDWVKNVFLVSSDEKYVTARKKVDDFTAYIAWGIDDTQDIVWTEPNDVELTITKRSETDFLSEEKYLVGAVFELYAWDGTSYSEKVAESVDNADGTYTFPEISYMSAVNGKFLVKEKMAPPGYKMPYYFYNVEDSSDYSQYGGREFILDKSYLEWSCESTQDDENALSGFTFYNKPEDTTITVTKVDADTNRKLTGAIFELYAWNGSDYSKKMGTFKDNGDGAYFIDIAFDASVVKNGSYSYLIKETKAPNGYIKSDVEIVVIYSKNGILQNSSSELIVSNKSQKGKLQLKKTSANTDITNSNHCYSVSGAEYTVYFDSACKNVAGVLKTDASGDTNILLLDTGEYYIKETKAPKGYVINQEVYEVNVDSSHYAAPYVFEVKDEPGMSLVEVLLQKVDADTMQSNPKGFASLENAEFTVKYYDAEGTKDPAEEGKIPLKTWIFKTDKEGFVYYHPDYFVTGDSLYKMNDGKAGLPLGVITIQETKASEGYQLNPNVYVIPITMNEKENRVNVYTIPKIPESILKLELSKVEFATETVISDAVFEYVRPDGSKEIRTTDSNGKILIEGLEYGTHSIKEISVRDSYYVNSNEIKFTVDKTNKITLLSTAGVSDRNGNITTIITPEGNIEIVVEDKLVPYSIQIMKTNDKGITLEDAEFTLYSDKDCTQLLSKGNTDKNGLLKFNGLIYGKNYYLKETKAPQGYKLPQTVPVYVVRGEASPVKETWNFWVNDVKYTIEDWDSSKSIYLSGNTSERILNLKIVNNIGLVLPETGSAMTVICFSVGITVMLGVLITNKRKNRK